MTTFDLFAFGTILFCIVLSAMRGLMGEVFSFVGWLVALTIARFLAVDVSNFMFSSMQPRELAVVCAFVATYVAARLALAFTHQVFDLVIKKSHLSTLNRIGGAALGSLKGVLVVSITVLLCAFSDLPKSSEWRDSISAPFFESIALMGTPYLPEFLAKQVNFDHSDAALPLGALPKTGNHAADGATRGATRGASNGTHSGAAGNGANNGTHGAKAPRAHANESENVQGSLKKDKSSDSDNVGSLKKQKNSAKKRASSKTKTKQSP